MPKPGPRRSFFEAAVTVLTDAGRPLTVDEIVGEALARGLIDSAGKTPVASMSSRLYTHVRDSEQPRVVRVFEQGPSRAVRGSVRWKLAPATRATTA